LPDGIVQPQKVSTVCTAFVRNPKVRAGVLKEAKGICEGCVSNAPFEVDGLPFLEVHHVKHLAQKGSDRISNAVALCPNCHQRCHRSSDRDEFTAGLYSKISRLIQE
jgi:5-methylcytosine-specific restriction protein A